MTGLALSAVSVAFFVLVAVAVLAATVVLIVVLELVVLATCSLPELFAERVVFFLTVVSSPRSMSKMAPKSASAMAGVLLLDFPFGA